MKHHLRLLAAFAVVLLGFAPLVPAQTVAGAPTTIDYQGKALDSVGSPLANATPTNFEMRFRIYDAQEGGTVIWSEKQVVTVSKGLFSVRLGEGTALSPAEGSVAQTALADAFAATARFLRYADSRPCSHAADAVFPVPCPRCGDATDWSGARGITIDSPSCPYGWR